MIRSGHNEPKATIAAWKSGGPEFKGLIGSHSFQGFGATRIRDFLWGCQTHSPREIEFGQNMHAF